VADGARVDAPGDDGQACDRAERRGGGEERLPPGRSSERDAARHGEAAMAGNRDTTWAPTPSGSLPTKMRDAQ